MTVGTHVAIIFAFAAGSLSLYADLKGERLTAWIIIVATALFCAVAVRF